MRTAALATSAAAVAGTVFFLIDYRPLDFVVVDGRIAVLLLVVAAVGAAGAMLGQRMVLAGLGGLLLLLAAVRVVTYGHGDGLVGGGSSTAAFFAGLGMLYVGIAIAGQERTRADA